MESLETESNMFNPLYNNILTLTMSSGEMAENSDKYNINKHNNNWFSRDEKFEISGYFPQSFGWLI